MSSLPAFTPGGATATLAVTAASGNVALNRNGANQVLVLNLGDAEAFVDFGDSAKTATTTDTPVPAGGWIMLSVPPDATHAAAITASGTATLRFTPGDGEFQGAAGGGGGGSSGNPSEVNLIQTGGNTLAADDAAAGTTVPVPVGGIYNTTPPTYTAGDRVQLQFNTSGDLINAPRTNATVLADAVAANVQIPRFTSTGGLAVASYTPVINYIWDGVSYDRERIPNATARLPSSAATTNATVAKASTGYLFNLVGYNTNAAVRYLKLYNKATAPTVGTDTPVLTIPLVPLAGFAIDFPKSFYFPLGIGYALTTGAADADTTAVGAGDVVGLNLAYS